MPPLYSDCVRAMAGEGLVGVFSLAVGGTFLSLLFIGALNTQLTTPLAWIVMVFIGFVIVGIGFLLIFRDAVSAVQRNPSQPK